MKNPSLSCGGSIGMANNLKVASMAPAIPKITLVSEPQAYTSPSGKGIKKEEVDIVAKMLSMGRFHRTFVGSGLYNLAAATRARRNCTE